ncbi:carbohydrate ABC transporter permease [Nocardia sp. SSK8]|uniref:carbohydrate ABC transporter permease n=1 Tax=Nocardia sp. SSK8 TaxID=3120154 RepID=UPI003009A944
MMIDRFRRAGSHLLLAGTALVCVFPIYWLFATSLRTPQDVGSLTPVPWPLSIENYLDAARKVDVAGLILNTGVVATLSAAGQLLIALLGCVLPTLCSALAILLLRQHMDGFPKELVAAAKMDGRGSWSILWTVVVPTLRPALAALAILLFINAWNEYFWPAVVLRRSDAVLQLGLRSFMSTEGDQWGPLMALAALACLPVLLLYLVLQRHIADAFVRSGLR